MPATSKSQQQAAAIAYKKKCKGEKKKPKQQPSKQMAKSMSCSELRKHASTERKGKPKHKSKKKS